MAQDPSELMPLVYDELRRLAASYVRGERAGQTLQATALVNEAFVRMAAERTRHFNGRTHFLAIAALSMRQILIQRARARRALKRGGAPARVTLNDERVALDVSGTYRDAKERALERFESAYLSSLMRRCNGNVSLASRQSEIARHHLRDLLRKRSLYGVGWDKDE